MIFLLDTPVWLWWHNAPERLSRHVRSLITDPSLSPTLLLSAISPWELCKLVQRKRLTLACDPLDWITRALERTPVQVVNLTASISYHSTTLPPPFHDDPADQIIVATARAEGATILTKDALILKYPHVKSMW